MTDAELKRLAEAATPGPWQTDPLEKDDGGNYFSVWADPWINASGKKDAMATVAAGEDGGCQRMADAAFVAAANPATVLRLLAEKEAAEKEKFALAASQCHKGYGDDHGNWRCNYQDENARLLERIAALRAGCANHEHYTPTKLNCKVCQALAADDARMTGEK